MEKIITPCISICKTDPSTGYCYGCARTSEEKAIWKDENTTNEWKKLFHLVYQYAKQIHLPDIVMVVLELLKKKRYGKTKILQMNGK